jgi:hypothetical protein
MKYCQFLEHYREYTQGNETPENVHLWLGLSAIAGTAGKQYWLNRGFFNVYLNLYILLLGPPGVISKSTSMDTCAEMLEDVDAIVYSGSITKAKLVEDMMESIDECHLDDGESFQHCSVTFLADEFNSLLASGGSDIVKFLTEIYSKDKVYKDRTKHQGQYTIPYPFVNLVGNLVPDWFGKNLANDISATGLLARFIPIYEDTTRGKFSKTIVTDKQLQARHRALEILFKIKSSSGEMKLSKDAEEFYDEWYNKQIIDVTEDSRISDYLVRKIKTHSLKVAGLMALGDLKTTIDAQDLKRAIHILDKVDPKLRLAYMMAGANPYAIHINRTLKVIEANEGKVSIKTVARMLRGDLDNDGFKSVIEQIETMGYARQILKGKEWFLERIID